jgi:hypothetical protein
MPRIMECALDNTPILLSFLFAQRHPFFPAVIVRIALVRKHVIDAICSGNIDDFRFFAEQKSIWNHRVTQLVRLAPGENTMFLTALLARKSRRGRERILKIFRQKWSPKGDYLFIRNLGAICGYRVAFFDHKEITWLPTSMPPKRCT